MCYAAALIHVLTCFMKIIVNSFMISYMPALEELLTFALKHKSDQRKVKTNKVQLRNMNQTTGDDRANKRHRSVDAKTTHNKR